MIVNINELMAKMHPPIDDLLLTLTHVDSLRLLNNNGDFKFQPIQAFLDGNGKEGKFETRDFALFRLDELTYDENDKTPHKEALENVISTMNITPGVNFVYLILGREDGISIYYGVARDYDISEVKNEIEINEIGQEILKPSILGNFRGSVVSEVKSSRDYTDDSANDSAEDLLKNDILDYLDSFDADHIKLLEGVPGLNEDDEKYQSTDRLIDVMSGEKFAFMLIAKPLTISEVETIRDRMFGLYDLLNPYIKNSLQMGQSENVNHESTSHVEGESWNNPVNDSSDNSSKSGHGIGDAIGSFTDSRNNQSFRGKYSSISYTVQNNNNRESTQYSISTNQHTEQNTTNHESKSNSDNISISAETINRQLDDWIKYMDDVIIPRVDYGKGKGVYVVSAVLFGRDKASLIKLENTVKSIYSSEKGNMMPMAAASIDENLASYFKRFQIPRVNCSRLEDNAVNIRTANSQYFLNSTRAMIGNWMTSREVSLFAGVPIKEVPGISLRSEVDFGLKLVNGKNTFPFANLVQSGVVNENIEVNFSSDYFDKHIFVTGVTGSGKTTTCQRLLMECRKLSEKYKRHFLVIEPAKTEYRRLVKYIDDLIVFTPGNEKAAPFRLNPFELMPGESITSRADMVKASIEASSELEAAIPQLIDEAIHECYIDKGWDIVTSENKYCKDPFADGVYVFPTLSDLLVKVVSVVDRKNFDDRLRDEYIGSIRAYLGNLCVGTKGLLLDTPRSINFDKLLDRNVVIELENIGSPADKSLIMGLILCNMNAAIKNRYNSYIPPETEDGKNDEDNEDDEDNACVKHIILIEEAHQLLSKYEYGDSRNKKQGVATFTNMLAEIRKYGESLIIADQIPNTMTAEVLKNTNTKIVHRLFAKDDKEAIGDMMALSKEQKEYLSGLGQGRAIFMYPELKKAVQIKIKKDESINTKRKPPKDSVLRNKVLEYYQDYYRSGILPGLEMMENKPSTDQLEFYLKTVNLQSSFWLEFVGLIFHYRDIPSQPFMETIGKFDELFSRNMFCDILAGFINARFATGRNSTDNEDRFSVIKNAVETLAMIYDNYLTNKEYNRKKDFDNSGSIGELYAMLSDFAGQHGISAQNEF